MSLPHIKHNKVRMLLDEEKRAYGAWLLIPSATMVEIAGYAGLDFVVIDNEQGAFNDETILQMIRCSELMEISFFVRVSDNNPGTILKILNMGADGIIVPHVRNRQDAEAAVRAARYAPDGFRGRMSCFRRDGYGQLGLHDYLRNINREIMVFLVIEDVEAFDHLDDIAQTPGVNVLLVGREDLAQSMGIPEEPGHQRILDCVAQVRKATAKAGIAFFGDQLIDAGIDQQMLLQGWKAGRNIPIDP